MGELQEKVNKFEFEVENMNTLNFEQLNQIKSRLQSKLKKVHDAEEFLTDNTYKCVACIDNKKNISFVDGCGHLALCHKCEIKMERKECPICLIKYTKIKILTLG